MAETTTQTFVQSILNSLSAHIAVLNRQGEIIYVNEAWNEFAKKNGDPTLKKTGVGVNYLEVARKAMVADAIAGEALSKLQAVMDRTLPSATLEYPCHSPEEKRWFKMSVTPLETGEVGVVASHENITKRKLAEEASRESEARLRSILDQAPVSIYIKDLEGRYVFLNVFAEKMLGLADEEVIGKRNEEILPPETAEQLSANDEGVIREGAPIKGEETIMGKDGPRTLLSTKFLLRKIGGEPYGLCGISTDISHRKQAEKEIETYTKRLEESNQALQDFAAFASHDLQEPLRKILGFGEVLSQKYRQSLDETGRDYLRRMEDAAARMSALIEDLLEYSRVTTKAKPFRDTNLNALLEKVTSDLELRIQRTGAVIQIEDLPTVNADPSQMRQVFLNLIGNALKFSEARPFIRISARSHEGRLEISVEDNGIGFDETKVDAIFRPFQRLHGRSAYEGKGMGLAIVKRIVERHGWKISARSRPGKGSTFVLTLPAHTAPHP